MRYPVAIVPTRRHVLPLLAFTYPLLWFVYLGAADDPLLPVAGRVLSAIILGYTGAMTVVTLRGERQRATSARPTFREALAPGDDTLAVLGVFVGGTVLFFVGNLVGAVPGWATALLLPFGLLLGLPLLVAVLAMTTLGNAAVWFQAPAVQNTVIALALGACGVWTVLLAAGVSRLLDRIGRRRSPRRGE